MEGQRKFLKKYAWGPNEHHFLSLFPTYFYVLFHVIKAKGQTKLVGEPDWPAGRLLRTPNWKFHTEVEE